MNEGVTRLTPQQREEKEQQRVDAVHRDALIELQRTGHIMGPWWPKNKKEKSRVCIIRGCHKTDIMQVIG